MISALLLALPGAGAGAGAGAAFALPEAFIGLWEGAVDYNILGPSFTFKFSVSRSPSGDYLMEDNINFDGMGMGWQRFYVEGSGSTAGAMWYCGSFNNFADNVEQTGSGRLNLFYPEDQSASSVSFCLDSEDPEVMGQYNPFKMGCKGCDCANFTIAHDAETDSLLTQMTMSGSSVGSKHLWATLGRIGPAPEVTDADMPAHGDDFSCDFSEGGRDSVPVVQDGNATSSSTSAEAPPHPVSSSSSSSSGCPYMRQQKAKNAAAVQRRAEPVPIMMGDTPPRAPKAASAVKATNSTAAAVAGGYQQCYSLSSEVGYRLQWTLDSDAQLLHCAVSVPLTDADGDSESDKYVAIGFRPLSRSTDTSLLRQNTGHHMNFAMAGADIVTGSVAAGVKTYYAQDYTGAPVADNSLELTDASVAVEEGGGEGSPSRVVLKFTRPLVGGYLLKHYDNPASINTAYADIIWATGKDIVKAEGGAEAEAVTCKYHSNGRGLRVVNWEDPSTAFSDDWRC